MSTWADLDAELDRWATPGTVATFWWRDDDAGPATPALERLLALASRHDVPLGLAVIPAALAPEAVRLIKTASRASVLQHGFRHLNQAPAGAKKSEFPPGRARDSMLDDLRQGARILRETFSDRAVPALVPPWNRIADELVAALPGIGILGLSTYRARACERSAPGLVQANCHVDLIDWHGGRGFIGEASALGLLVGHLEARRTGAVDRLEPSGILSHHAVHDEPSWAFLERLLEYLARSRHGRFVPPAALFLPSGHGG